jgi:transcription termination factor Rho
MREFSILRDSLKKLSRMGDSVASASALVMRGGLGSPALSANAS